MPKKTQQKHHSSSSTSTSTSTNKGLLSKALQSFLLSYSSSPTTSKSKAKEEDQEENTNKTSTSTSTTTSNSPLDRKTQNRIRRILNRSRNRRSRMSFFLTECPSFFFFLLFSYGGIIWVTYEILTADAYDADHSLLSSNNNTFVIARFLFQKLSAIATMLAFISFWMQAHGCIGEHGIQPIKSTLRMTSLLSDAGALTLHKYAYQPTIFWLNGTDKFLHCVLCIGTLSAACIFVNVWYPFINCLLFLLCALLYSSLKIVGAEFLQLQWDSMLIEVNLICAVCEFDALFTCITLSDSASTCNGNTYDISEGVRDSNALTVTMRVTEESASDFCARK